jgi:hypothetical protein
MQVTKRSVFIAYINVLIVAAIVTFAVAQMHTAERTEKRQHYVDILGITCEPGPEARGANSTCGEFGSCEPLFPEQPLGEHICVCDDGYTSWNGICDYKRLPQVYSLLVFVSLLIKFNAFMASFFGGYVGADWFYLFNGGTNGGYGVAGVFKLLTGGGFSIWWLVDWIRVLTMSFPDGNIFLFLKTDQNR